MTESARSAKDAADRSQGAAASLLNGLAVLESFTIAEPVLGVTEIAGRVDLHKSTVSRILSGLAQAGYVERVADSGRYRLGLGVIALSGPLLAELDVRRAAESHLEQLTADTAETSAVCVWNGTAAVVVEQVASPHQVKHAATIGTRYDKVESSSVRVFLAELPPERAATLLDAGVLRHDTSPRSRGLTGEAHLEQVRRQGYAVNDGLTTVEEFGVSAPVRDYRGLAVACITASAPRARIQRDGSADEIAAAVRAAAGAVSARLGGSGPTAARDGRR